MYLYWWIYGIILCNYKRVIFWFDLLERFIDWNCGIVILIWITNIIQFCWRMDRRSLKQNYNESLAMSLLEIICSSRSSCVLHLFFVFEGLWWKLFRALEAWIRRASLIYCFLKSMEAFELDSSELWDLGRWFLFECSLYSKVWGESSLRIWRLESVELHQFVVS